MSIELGKVNQLEVVKEVDFGVYLDGGEEGEILLPTRYVPVYCKIGDFLNVFLYLDMDERLIATTLTPLVQVGQFACLEVSWVNQYGAFLNWGLMKDLFVPFREQKMNAVILKDNIDNPFISHLEAKNEKVKFQRIDADVTDSMKEEGDEETLKKQTETLSDVFKKALGKDQLEVQVQNLKNENISSMITLSEETRRMQDMMKMYSAGGMGMDMSMFGGGETLILNANNALVKYILEHTEGEHVDMFCKQLYDLAMLANKPLPAEEMTDFVARSNEIMLLLTQE